MDRLKALLGDQPARQRDKSDRGADSREKERSILNHADAKYNKQVYENEKRQADLYDQSQMPESSRDVGVSFKIGSFVNKISQLLSFKNDLFTQLSALINLGTSPSRLLTDSRLISIATDYFKMTDIIANYNELVNYINLYAPQMKADEDFKSGVNTTYLLPLLALLQQTANLYVAGFNAFPNARQGNQIDRDAYDRMRNASSLAYSTIMLMNDNLKVDTGGKYNIIAGHKMGFTFASQMTEMETIRSESTFGNIIRGLQVYGYKVVKPEALAQAVVTFA